MLPKEVVFGLAIYVKILLVHALTYKESLRLNVWHKMYIVLVASIMFVAILIIIVKQIHWILHVLHLLVRMELAIGIVQPTNVWL